MTFYGKIRFLVRYVGISSVSVLPCHLTPPTPHGMCLNTTVLNHFLLLFDPQRLELGDPDAHVWLRKDSGTWLTTGERQHDAHGPQSHVTCETDVWLKTIPGCGLSRGRTLCVPDKCCVTRRPWTRGNHGSLQHRWSCTWTWYDATRQSILPGFSTTPNPAWDWTCSPTDHNFSVVCFVKLGPSHHVWASSRTPTFTWLHDSCERGTHLLIYSDDAERVADMLCKAGLVQKIIVWCLKSGFKFYVHWFTHAVNIVYFLFCLFFAV